LSNICGYKLERSDDTDCQQIYVWFKYFFVSLKFALLIVDKFYELIVTLVSTFVKKIVKESIKCIIHLY